MSKQKDSKIIDIYSGENIIIWKDDEYVFVSFPWTTLNIPLEYWEEVKSEFLEIGEL